MQKVHTDVFVENNVLSSIKYCVCTFSSDERFIFCLMPTLKKSKTIKTFYSFLFC